MTKTCRASVLVSLLFFYAVGARCGAAGSHAEGKAQLLELEAQIWSQKQELAMNEIRMIATAIELYSAERHKYPGPTGTLQPIKTIESALKPEFLRRVDLFDPWGRPYLYWSDGDEYLLVSTSADGRVDKEYEPILGRKPRDLRQALSVGASSDVTSDLVFLNGQFRAWYRMNQ